ncbi:tumor necrosis factor ligand superfamily member 13B isoform X2 [Hippocampus zosterae]|uniref:tumor necrosis factor ligand superfamily member 13B isoform X2 n=1 Tax=Hippocampus zosterae TaxID=109293 RepID=UPI00223D0E05|nr:tumor necrosis factor ligand superfamily member 13B isoform X2 [Hippocampus zosterae]
MAVGSHLDPGACQKAVKVRGLSRPVLLLTLAVITSSSLSALSLYRLVVLSAEVDGLKSEVFRRREESQEAKRGEQDVSDKRSGQDDRQHPFTLLRRRRMVSGTDTSVSQSCLQLLADKSRKIFRKDFALEPYTGIPWMTGLTRGSSLEVVGDNMLVREEGFYFVYSQVCNGPRGDPQEEDGGGRRGSVRDPVPLHSEHGQRVPLQHVLHRRCREAGSR